MFTLSFRFIEYKAYPYAQLDTLHGIEVKKSTTVAYTTHRPVYPNSEVRSIKRVYKFAFPLSILLILIPFESFGNRIGLPVQTMSVFSAFSILLLPFVLIYGFKRSSLLRDVALFSAYIILVTLINILREPDLGPYATRQTVALFIGILQFLILRFIFFNSHKNVVASSILMSFYVSALYGMFEILARKSRIQAFFTEPSHYGQFLAFIVLPSLFYFRSDMKRLTFYLLIALWFVQLIFTFSTTAMIRAILVILSIVFLSKSLPLKYKIRVLILLIVAVVMVYMYAFVVNPNNYMARIISYSFFRDSDPLESSVSVSDRAAFFIILSNLKPSLNTLFGYGLGSEAIKYQELLPTSIVTSVLLHKHYGYFIPSLMGKIIVAGGFVGLIMYVGLMMKIIFRCLKVNHTDIIAGVLLGLLLYSSIGLGPLQMVELWFWLAFADVLLQKREESHR